MARGSRAARGSRPTLRRRLALCVRSLDPTLAKQTGYYRPMVQFLTAQGYTAGRDLHAAPYDWRMGPDGLGVRGGMYDKLQALVESSFKNNGLLPVHLVTHSLGGCGLPPPLPQPGRATPPPSRLLPARPRRPRPASQPGWA